MGLICWLNESCDPAFRNWVGGRGLIGESCQEGWERAAGCTADPSTSVAMTILLQTTATVPLYLLRPQQNCHPDRSVAQWRDLLFLSGQEAFLVL